MPDVKFKTPLSIDDLSVLVDYDSDSGKLYFKSRGPEWFSKPHYCDIWNNRYSGKEAFNSLTVSGYLRGVILNQTLYTHRVAWALYYKSWPKDFLDHIDGDKKNNVIANLREVSRVGNGRNQKVSARNVSGVQGVCWHKSHSKWYARIGDHGGQINLGYFDDIEEAIVARDLAKASLGFHPNHGRL